MNAARIHFFFILCHNFTIAYAIITGSGIIQSILQSGFSRIMAEKLLHLQDADPERVLELEKISDGRGRHPLGQLPEKEE